MSIPGTPEEVFEATSQSVPQDDSLATGETDQDEQMIRGRFAVVIILLMILLADTCLYDAAGFFGPAVFFVGAAALLMIGIPHRSIRFISLLLVAQLGLLAYRLAVNGAAFQVVAGSWLLSAMVVAFRGRTPFVLETMVFAAESVPGGYEFYRRLNNRVRRHVLDPMDAGQSSRMVEVILPAFVAAVFSGIFVMANPDVVNWFSGELTDLLDIVARFFRRFSPFEVIFWCLVGWLAGGLLRPVVSPQLTGMEEKDTAAWGTAEAPLYKAFRNTLVTLILVFGIYLTFESRAFLSKALPDGFTYSSYAHEGAAWLTVALGLATLTLSLIFRGRTLCDPRLSRLKTMAWIWSAFNLILAAAVYNRMWIYIDYNGMTRMRTIGLLGITSVGGGFLLVLIKIGRRRDFLWLIRRQLWVVALATYIYLILPVDVISHKYNVRQILNGNEGPIVQVTAHDVDDEALPELLPLCNVSDERLREGVQAFLSKRFAALKQRRDALNSIGWTARQLSADRTYVQLESKQATWDIFDTHDARDSAWQRLSLHAFNTWW